MENISCSKSGNALTISSNDEILSKVRECIFRKLGVPIDDSVYQFNFEEIESPKPEKVVPGAPVLNNFQKRAASYLSLCLEIPIDDFSDIRKIPEFQPELFGKTLQPVPIEAFHLNQFVINYPQALFLIEIFATNQTKEEQCNYHKKFEAKKTIYNLALLADFPVAFEVSEPNKSVKISFADTNIATAQLILSQVKLALNVFSSIKLEVAQFLYVDSSCCDIYKVQEMSNELGFAMIRTDDFQNEESASFAIWAIPNQPGVKYRKIFESKCNEIFEKMQLIQCEFCHKYLMSEMFDADNVECRHFEHKGERKVMPNGKMEMEETMPDGSKMIFVKYSCCGKVPKFGDEGCEEVIFDHHSRSRYTISKLFFSVT
ncbi:hypothetical protein GPJ56_000243 [Histomonas meleagridis]|uniref:uncharacterized protein n=1 Tax=Histomonas meleagridis TaxID=135588 RepID=UPI00355A1702|nr:hypothetical protein GPJ56_000243 [Histomonas meleagridis]KAH0799730.1 hypothetical protein GO595_007451 [Histomonas meleagridis]